MKNKKYHSFGTVPKSNIKIVERGKTDMTRTQIHDCWLQENSGKVKLVLWSQTFDHNQTVRV